MIRGRGMVYGGGLMSKYSAEIFQVEVHQSCIVVLVFLCKETEFVTLVEPRCCSERIYCNKATTCSISMSKYVLQEIGNCKVFCLIIFRFIQQKIVQVAFGTLERSKISLGCQYPNGYIGEIHLNKGQSGELCLNISYACRALSFSSSDTGEGWSMCQRKRSASLPVSIGVSLIGLAIINLYLVSAANIQRKIE